MKIISTNISEPQVVNWHGKEVKTGIFKYPVNQPVYCSKLQKRFIETVGRPIVTKKD